MHKFDCKDCSCLIEWAEGKNSSGWGCDNCGKDITAVDECPEGIKELSVGDEVYWEDPDGGLRSGNYKVFKILNSDVLVIGDGAGSETEVFYHECE